MIITDLARINMHKAAIDIVFMKSANNLTAVLVAADILYQPAVQTEPRETFRRVRGVAHAFNNLSIVKWYFLPKWHSQPFAMLVLIGMFPVVKQYNKRVRYDIPYTQHINLTLV